MGNILDLLKLLVQFVPVGVKLLWEAYKAYQDWKERHPDAPKPAQAFVEAKVLNPITTPIIDVPSTLKPIPAPDPVVQKAIKEKAKTDASEAKQQAIAEEETFKAIKNGKSVVPDFQPGEGSDPKLGYVQNDPQKKSKK